MSQTISNLNDGQKAASDAFHKFLLSNDKEFNISGPGGVGKTHLMKHIMDTTMMNYFETCKMVGLEPVYVSVEMTATTNKATDVLSQATNRPCSTLHSFLNLKVRDDYKTGKTIIERTTNWFVHENKVIFIDECSTVDSQLYQALHHATKNCKIVFVGDHCQLAPVMEKISPIYNQRIPFYELTQQMRNSGQPALMSICNQLRDTVKTGVFHPITEVPGVIDYLDDTRMQTELDNYFHNQTLDAKILAYTNNQVMAYNDYIRNIRHLPDEYTVGEYLVNNMALHLKTRMVPVEQQFLLKDLAPPEKMQIALDKEKNPIELDISNATIELHNGDILANIPMPVDRSHYHSLMNFFKRAKNWDRYFFMKNNIPDWRPRDASTVYKAQGSTFDTVFIDLANLSTIRDPQQAARSLYVAFSRARSRIFLYGKLSQKYGG